MSGLNRATLLKRLREGATPHDLSAEKLGQGSQRSAYKLGKYVIKENTGPYHENPGPGGKPDPECLAQWATSECRYTEEWVAGPYVVQPYVPSVPEGFGYSSRVSEVLDIADEFEYDLGRPNMGLDTETDWLVVFDY